MKEENKSIAKYISDFLDYLEVEKGLSSNTQENYDRYLKKFSLWLEKNGKSGLAPGQLSADDIWNYRLYLSRHLDPKTKKTLKKNTQAGYLIALRALLSYFAEKDITSLPADKIKLPKEASKERTVRFLKLDQIEKLLLAPNLENKIGLRDRAILETLFSTGLRVAELVELNRDRIPIKQDIKDLEINIVGKGNVPRTVFLSERALFWLKKYLETRKDIDGALFVHYSGRKDTDSKRLTARSVENIVKKYSKLAGLPFLATPHTLRHSYATDLLNQGVDLRMVQEFLGHKSITTTQVYTHVTNKRLRDIHRQYHGGKKLKNI